MNWRAVHSFFQSAFIELLLCARPTFCDSSSSSANIQHITHVKCSNRGIRKTRWFTEEGVSVTNNVGKKGRIW